MIIHAEHRFRRRSDRRWPEPRCVLIVVLVLWWLPLTWWWSTA